MPDFTLCLAYYENAGMLAHQLAALNALPAALRDHVSLIVVDDGSPNAPAVLPPALGFEARLYRMKADIPWNQDACRNLAVEQAADGWLLLTDMDHVPSVELVDRIVRGKLDPRCAYTFGRVSAPDLSPYKPHPNSWLMTRDTYRRTGGYDERYAGVYGTDGMFAKRLRAVAPVRALAEVLIRYPREVIADASTTTLTRKSKENDARKDHVTRLVAASGRREPMTGLTPWERVA